MDERRRFLIKIVMLLRLDMRKLFGLEVANRWGFFVDMHLSRKVRDFAGWMNYPKGDRVLKGHSESVYSAVVTDDGYLLFTGSRDGKMIAWNMGDFSIVREWKCHEDAAFCSAYKCGLLVSGGRDKTVKIWDTLRDYHLVHTLKGHRNEIENVDINDKATQVVSGARDKTVRLWSLETGKCIRELTGHSGRVNTVLFVGELALSAADYLNALNTADGTVKKLMNKHVKFMAINRDATEIACLESGKLVIYTWPELSEVCMMKGFFDRVAIHPTRPNIIAVETMDEFTVQLYDSEMGSCIRTLKGHSDYIYSLCFSVDGSRLISVATDKTVRVWDISDLLF